MKAPFVIGILAVLLITQDSSAAPLCRPCPFACDTIGVEKRECKDLKTQPTKCCVELTKRGRAQFRVRTGAANVKVVKQSGQCPVGFHANERPCSPEQREQGCVDASSSTGHICTSWLRPRLSPPVTGELK